MRGLCRWGVVALGITTLCVSAQALEPSAILGLNQIPVGDRDTVYYLESGGERWNCDNPAFVYDNSSDMYMYLRVPDSGDGTLWVAEDIEMLLPNGAVEWGICQYGYRTYAFGGTAPYDIHSSMYRYDDCTISPVSLVDWMTGTCCVSAEEIPGTEADVTIPVDGSVEVTINLPTAPVTVDKWAFMVLDYSGANVADNAGWIIAYEAELGYTDDVWVEDIMGVGCGGFWFGGDPYAGFRAWITGESAGVIELVPYDATGGHSIDGDTINVNCDELPMDVQLDTIAHHWGPSQLTGHQSTLNCALYYSNPYAGPNDLVASNTPCWPGPCAAGQIGFDKTRADYIFPLGDYPACNVVNMCHPTDPPDSLNGWYGCLSGATSNYDDDGTAKHMHYYSFTVPAGAKGCWQISLDPDPLYTTLKDPFGIDLVPLTRTPAYICVEMGMCCYNIGGGTADCTDYVTECECDALDGNPLTHFWNAGEYCPPPPESCCQCTSDMDCADGDACTEDTCDNCICYHDAVTVPAESCCDSTPANVAADVGGDGAIAGYNDGDPCTDDYCNPGTGCAVDPYCGAPAHDLGPGNLCCEVDPAAPDKPAPCTFDDSCNWYCVGVDGVIHPLVLCGAEPPGFCEGIEPMAVCEWVCAGEDVNVVPCVDDTDCLFNMGTGDPCPPDPVQFECKWNEDLMADMCYCAPLTRLWIDVLDEDCCFAEGEMFDVDIKKTAGADTITGAQFRLVYDPDCITYNGFTLGADFPLLLMAADDPVAGTLFLAVGITPFTGNGTSGPATFATLSFTKGIGCVWCDICFESVNPQNTILVNDKGEEVTMVSWGCSNNGDACETNADCEDDAQCGCSCVISPIGEGTMDLPDMAEVNSDCMMTTAVVTWDDPPSVDITCNPPIDLAGPDGIWGTQDDLCYGVHEVIPGKPEDQMSPEYIMTLIEGGGEFAQGITTFCCDAYGECDIEVSGCWTVDVSDQNSMNVIVQYSPEMTMGPYVRGIVFELFWDCWHDPTVECKDMTFGPPFDFTGKSTEVLKVTKGEYMCITAADPLHTLRSVDMPIECVGNSLLAAFHGDPILGGNWLVGGNINGDQHIDIVDFGLFLAQYMMVVGADTPCGTAGPHADLNGDGTVNSADFSFIAENFLAESKDACCDDPTSNWQGDPVLSLSMKEARLLGMPGSVDLNGDGYLNEADMAEFMQGTQPDRVKRGARSLGR